jgi:hypothetical protein
MMWRGTNAVHSEPPKCTILDILRKKGQVRFANRGKLGHGISQGSTIRSEVLVRADDAREASSVSIEFRARRQRQTAGGDLKPGASCEIEVPRSRATASVCGPRHA